MEIQSTININKFIEISVYPTHGEEYKEQIGFLSANLDKNGNQCVINIQLFDDEKIKENNVDVEKQVAEFFQHLSACMSDSKLEVVGKLLPEDKEIDKKVMEMNI